MSKSHLAVLPDRGVVSVTGTDARGFLDNLITNDVDLLDRQDAIHAGLLTPQGKILFAFHVVRRPDGFLLETARASAADLVKRLSLYRLRAKVVINDLSASHAAVVAWGGEPPASPLYVAFADPRHRDLGWRLLMAPAMATKLAGEDEGSAAWDGHRIALGVPEAGADYALGDTFPHEADFDLFAGVSFTKGCFVGQEVVARMQHKTVVRKRVVRIGGAGTLASGAPVKVGDATIGMVGTVAGRNGLALLRIDRAAEAQEKGQPLTAGDVAITVDAEMLDRYATAALQKASAP
ncbi:MAG: folate-binding protein [Hyphomicrobiaceae bacterium]|nr:folate-binding protein [Hyphomicrobiaceae bacterium]